MIAESTNLGVQVSSICQLLLIVLVLGAGTDYGVFLVFRVREELRRGLTPQEAVVRSVSRVGESITFSAFTVIAALMSLVLAQFAFYQSLGPALAIGIGLMLLAGSDAAAGLLADLRSSRLLADRHGRRGHRGSGRPLGPHRRHRHAPPGITSRPAWRCSAALAPRS